MICSKCGASIRAPGPEMRKTKICYYCKSGQGSKPKQSPGQGRARV